MYGIVGLSGPREAAPNRVLVDADLLKWRANDQDDILALSRIHPYFQFRLIATQMWLRMCLEGESGTQLSDALLQIKRS